MHSILFSTREGSPIAILGLSEQVAPVRDCIFVVAARDNETHNSREGEIVLPDRPTEYTCDFSSGPDGTMVAFANQNGWHFLVRLDAEEEGEWSATRDGETVSGHAMSLARAHEGH
jgi:hypothetical protein